MASSTYGAWMRAPSNPPSDPRSDPIGSVWTPLEDSDSEPMETDEDGDVSMDHDDDVSELFSSRATTPTKHARTGLSDPRAAPQAKRTVQANIFNRLRPVEVSSYQSPRTPTGVKRFTLPAPASSSPTQVGRVHPSPSLTPVSRTPLALASSRTDAPRNTVPDWKTPRSPTNMLSTASPSYPREDDGFLLSPTNAHADMSSIRERGSLIPPRDLPLTPPASRTYAPDNTPAASSDGLLFTTSSRPTDPLPRFATANAPVAAAAAHAAHTLPSRGAPGRPSLGSSIDPITIDSDEERSSPPRTPKAFRTTTIASPSSPVRRRLLDPAVLQSSALLRALDDPNNSPVRAPPLSELGTTGPKTAATPTLSSHATPSAPKPPAVRPLPLSATPRAAASASANNSTTPRTVHHPTSASASKPAFPGKSATIPGASRFRVPVPPLTSPGKSKSSPNKTAPGSRKPAFSGTARPMPSAIQSIITRSVSITSDSTLPEVDEVIKATLASRTTDSALIPHDVIDLTGDDDASMSPASSVLTINSEDEVIAHLTPPFQSSPTLVPKTPKMGIQQGLTSPKKSGDVTSLEIH